MSFYPDFPSPDETLWALRLVIQHQQEDSEYLFRDECPYSDEFTAAMASLIASAGGPGEPGTPGTPGEDKPIWEGLEAETRGLYLDLKAAHRKVKDNDSSSQMSFFRTATALLEKLVGLQERATGIKELHEFKAQTFKVIDSVLTEEQRQKVLTVFRRTDDQE